MHGVDKGGLSGEAAKAEWLPHVMEAKQREDHKRFNQDFHKVIKVMPFKPNIPWTSLGQAPTDEQLEENDYGGCC